MPDEENQLMLPGDIAEQIKLDQADGSMLILGPGLRKESGSVVTVTRPGLLRHTTKGESRVFWVDCHSRRYVPTRGENVIGVVVAKVGDFFRVDIGTAEMATLSYLAFEGATKKNRPNVNVGDVVYAKLLVASKDMESELVCVDSYGRKAGLGILGGDGFVFKVPLHVVRKLLAPDCILLKALGESIPFEVAVGMNGRIWIRAKSVRDTISLSNAILAAEFMTNDEVRTMIKKLLRVMQGFA